MESKEYWNNRYKGGGNSGYGSYGEQLNKKLNWLKGLSVNSITDIGCGDFNFGKNLMEIYPKADYFGFDISEVVVAKNKQLYPQFTFSSEGIVPQADLVLCIDVLFHLLDDAEYERMLVSLEKVWTKYLVVTAYERNEDLGNHVKIRNFDYKRFGEPILRKVVEEDGNLYFYIFEKKPKGVDLKNVSACFITKFDKYPKEILDNISQYPFGEIMILTNCDSPHRKQELFAKAKYDWIYYQDDDCIAPIAELAEQAGNGITCAMKTAHIKSYSEIKIALLGWGSIFPKSIIKVLDKYRAKYGEDALYKRETERIMTLLSYNEYPQHRLDLPILDLPWAFSKDRLSMQPGHYDYINEVIAKCATL